MKIKTSITLSEKVLKAIDQLIKGNSNRSAFIEQGIWFFLEHLRRMERDKRELEILNQNAEKLNKQAKEILSYQTKL